MPWTNPETFTAGQTLTAASMNIVSENTRSLARGYIARADRTSNVTISTSALANVTDLSVTFTAESSRLYLTSVLIPVITQNTTQEFGVLAITDGSGSTKQQVNKRAAAAEQYTLFAQLFETGLSGSITRKAMMSVSANTLTLSMSSTIRGFILVEDIGPA